jgi:carbohydrate diacid regulator
VQEHIYVTDETGQVVAGSDGSPPGCVREVAARAIAGGTLARDDAVSPSVIAVPLVYNGLVVGAIALADGSAYGEELAYMARALSELVIHQTTVIEQLSRHTWARQKFLFDLLHGQLASTPDRAQDEAALLGIDIETPRVVALVAVEVAEGFGNTRARSVLPLIEHELRRKQWEVELLDLARDAIGSRQTEIACFIGNRWLAFVPPIDAGTADTDRHRIARDVQRFVDVATANLGSAAGGVGRYYAGWPALAQSFADARFALEMGRQIYGPARVYMPSDLGVASFVCSNDPVLKDQLAHQILSRIADEPELLNTIEVFLDADLSPSLAAARLHIHRHTLAHRLDKVTRLTGLDPRRFHDLAQLHAALVLRRICA